MSQPQGPSWPNPSSASEPTGQPLPPQPQPQPWQQQPAPGMGQPTGPTYPQQPQAPWNQASQPGQQPPYGSMPYGNAPYVPGQSLYGQQPPKGKGFPVWGYILIGVVVLALTGTLVWALVFNTKDDEPTPAPAAPVSSTSTTTKPSPTKPSSSTKSTSSTSATKAPSSKSSASTGTATVPSLSSKSVKDLVAPDSLGGLKKESVSPGDGKTMIDSTRYATDSPTYVSMYIDRNLGAPPSWELRGNITDYGTHICDIDDDGKYVNCFVSTPDGHLRIWTFGGNDAMQTFMKDLVVTMK